MKSIRLFSLIFLSVLMFCGYARAVRVEEVKRPIPESPQNGAFELRMGPYYPGVDDEPALGASTPYRDTFGSDSLFLIEIEVDWQFWRWPGGTLGIGGSFGFMQAYTPAVSESGEESSEYTVLNIMPFRLPLVARIDWFARDPGIPLVPYFKIGLDYYVWWILDAGDVADFNGREGSGGTFGWHVAGGMMIQLDPIDHYAARTFDNEVGVNNSYIFFEYYYADISQFGAGDAMYLGDDAWVAGIALEF